MFSRTFLRLLFNMVTLPTPVWNTLLPSLELLAGRLEKLGIGARRCRMFRLLPRRANPSGLLTSTLYDERRFYFAFAADLKRARREVIIESPYLTCKRVNELLPIFKRLTQSGVRVRVNTRNPNHHDEYLRIQAWMAFKRLRAAGVRVRLCNDMRHRKLAVIDGRILWEGSLNALSQNNSREIMRRTESEELCAQMIRFAGLKRSSW